MVGAAKLAHPKETGGVLVGVRVHGRPWVTHALEIRSRDSGPAQYILDGDARQSAVDEIREIDWRIGYIGEWHSHPANTPPTSRDIRSIARLARDPEAECPHPVLVVVRCKAANWVLDATQWQVARASHVRLIAAGGLPRAEETS